MHENKAILYGKMAQVMAQVSRIKETGKHSQGWKYATSEDVKDAVRVAMAEAGLALLVSLESSEVISLEKGVLVRGEMAFTICCSETGATETRKLTGEAADQSKVSDKAFYKLYTTLTKYFLRTTFLISSGEELDSDADNVHNVQQISRTPPKPFPDNSPPKGDFFARAKDVGFEPVDAAQVLKAAGFTNGYKPAEAPQMWAAIIKEYEIRKAAQIVAVLPMLQSTAVQSAAEPDQELADTYPEIFSEEIDKTSYENIEEPFEDQPF